MKKYNDILNIFVADYEHHAVWMKKPFFINELALATDGHMIAYCDNSLANITNSCEEEKASYIQKFLPTQINKHIVYDVEELKQTVLKFNLHGTFDCDACNGSGELEYEFYHKGKYYKNEGDCKVCNGVGKFSNLDYSIFKIGNANFLACFFVKIINAALKLNLEEIELVYQIDNEYKGSLFKVGELNVYLMPYLTSEEDLEDKTVYEITEK